MKKFLITACLTLTFLSPTAFAKDKKHSKPQQAADTGFHVAAPGSVEQTTNVVRNLSECIHDDYLHAIATCSVMGGRLVFTNGDSQQAEYTGEWQCTGREDYLYTIHMVRGFSDIVEVQNEPVVRTEMMIRAYGQPTRTETRDSKWGGSETLSIWDLNEYTFLVSTERANGSQTLAIHTKSTYYRPD